MTGLAPPDIVVEGSPDQDPELSALSHCDASDRTRRKPIALGMEFAGAIAVMNQAGPCRRNPHPPIPVIRQIIDKPPGQPRVQRRSLESAIMPPDHRAAVRAGP
jgi:hypothetical protein